MRDREDVSEQQRLKIDPHVREERQEDEADGKPSVREQTEQRIGRQGVTPFQVVHGQDD